MLKFSAHRTTGNDFGSRSAFLRSKPPTGRRNKPICHAHAQAYAGFPRAYSQNGYPWVTLVLGSGCLEGRGFPDTLRPGDLPSLIQAAMKRIGVDPDVSIAGIEGDTWRAAEGGDLDGLLAGEVVRRFIVSLGDDRLPDGWLKDKTSQEGQQDPWWDQRVQGMERPAKLVLLAAYLTRFYYQVRSRQGVAAVGRGVDYADASRLDEFDEHKKLIRDLRLMALDSCQEDDESLKGLLRAIGVGLDDKQQLSLLDLQLLTELAWYEVTRERGGYPGWSDLLANLAIIRQGPHDRFLDKRGPRPSYDGIIEPADEIKDLFLGVTQRSWQRSHGAGALQAAGPRPQNLHVAAATLLREQARVRRGMEQRRKDEEAEQHRLDRQQMAEEKKLSRAERDRAAAARQQREASKKVDERGAEPPPPAAFVTTFDLELEMSLWEVHQLPFVVALPVNVIVEGGTTAISCWLGRVVRPESSENRDDELDQLRSVGSAADWFVLSAFDNYLNGSVPGTDERIGDLPVVVRLSGSPLMKLPPLSSEGPFARLTEVILEHLVVATSPDQAQLVHAVIVDEFASLRQSVSELYSYAPQSKRLGLPPAITGGGSDTFARYWTLLGVQLGDPGVRYRFSSQLLSPLLGESDDKERPVPSGVAVTKRFDLLSRDILLWHGLDAVAATCEEFVDDIWHCVDHLAAPDPVVTRTNPESRCGLEEDK